MELAAYAAMASVVLNLIIVLLGLRGIAESNRRERSKAIEQINKTISESELASERKIGELGTAIRTKITEVEFYTRDNFVRDVTFHDTVKLMTSNMETQFGRLDTNMNRLGDKLDQLIREKAKP